MDFGYCKYHCSLIPQQALRIRFSLALILLSLNLRLTDEEQCHEKCTESIALYAEAKLAVSFLKTTPGNAAHWW